MFDYKDEEIRNQEMKLVKMDDKRVFDWKVIGTVSFTVLMAICIGTSVLGGDFNVKLPKNYRMIKVSKGHFQNIYCEIAQ